MFWRSLRVLTHTGTHINSQRTFLADTDLDREGFYQAQWNDNFWVIWVIRIRSHHDHPIFWWKEVTGNGHLASRIHDFILHFLWQSKKAIRGHPIIPIIQYPPLAPWFLGWHSSGVGAQPAGNSNWTVRCLITLICCSAPKNPVHPQRRSRLEAKRSSGSRTLTWEVVDVYLTPLMATLTKLVVDFSNGLAPTFASWDGLVLLEEGFCAVSLQYFQWQPCQVSFGWGPLDESKNSHHS